MKSEMFRNQSLFLRNQFTGDGVAEIPILKKQDVDLSQVKLIGYDKIKLGDTHNRDKMVHFFLDDYKFEALWRDPEPRIEKLRQYKAVLSPQYSVYTEMPSAIHMYNIFRSRWVGAYCQLRGIKVIPTVYWGQSQSYWFCFDGIEKGSIVALSTLSTVNVGTYYTID